MWQGDGNNFPHRQIFRRFYKQAITTEIFQLAFIEPIFCNEEYIAWKRFSRFGSFIFAIFNTGDLHEFYSFPKLKNEKVITV